MVFLLIGTRMGRRVWKHTTKMESDMVSIPLGTRMGKGIMKEISRTENKSEKPSFSTNPPQVLTR